MSRPSKAKLKSNPAAISSDDAEVRVDQVLAQGEFRASDWSMRVGDDDKIHVRGIVPYPIEDTISARGIEYVVDDLIPDQIWESGAGVEAAAYVTGQEEHIAIENRDLWSSTYSKGLPIYLISEPSWGRSLLVFGEDHASALLEASGALRTAWSALKVDVIEPGSPDWRNAIAVARAATERFDVHRWARQTASDLGLERFDVRARSQRLWTDEQNMSTWVLDLIVVPREHRGRGVGTLAMQRLVDLADEHKKIIVLALASRGEPWGTSSRSRLIKFYKRFGFVENKGKNKDFAISESMYRLPRFPSGSEKSRANPRSLKRSLMG